MLDILATGIFDSRERYQDMKETPLRTTKYYELEFFLSATGTAVLNDKKVEHKKGLTLFITPQTNRYTIGSFSCFYIHFMPDENIKNLLKDFDTTASYQESYLAEQFLKIIELYNSPDVNCRLELEAEILNLLKTVLFNTREERAPLIEKSKEFIENNFHKNLDLDQIAKEINLSPTYFHKKFKECYCITPREFLLKVRLKNAKRMLLTSDLNFFEISENCGFSSQAYFNFQFKKETGMTPGEYRSKRYQLPE